MKTNQKKLPKSQIEIEFELTAEEFEHYIGHALSHMKSHVKVDGFRPGQAPNKLVEEKIKPESLLMEAGDHAVRHVYSDYVKDNNLEPIGQPDVKIVKIAKGNPFVFTATITVLPDVELPDYKEITKKIKANKEILVTDEEVQDALNYLQKTRAKFIAKNEEAQKGDFVEIIYQNKDINAGKEVDDKFILGEGGFMKGFEESIVGMKAGEEKEFKVMFPENNPNKGLAGKEGDFKVKLKSVQKMELPEIDNEFAKGMGAFDTLVALKQSMKEGMIIEKTEQEKQRKRGEILERVSKEVKIELPEKLVEYEQERLFEDLKDKIAENFKISWEEYLASVKKTEKEIKDTFKLEAEKRLASFLVLKEIGKKEGIEVSEKELEEETKKAMAMYTKEQLANIDTEQLKEYTKGVVFNEKVFLKLEDYSK